MVKSFTITKITKNFTEKLKKQVAGTTLHLLLLIELFHEKEKKRSL